MWKWKEKQPGAVKHKQSVIDGELHKLVVCLTGNAQEGSPLHQHCFNFAQRLIYAREIESYDRSDREAVDTLDDIATSFRIRGLSAASMKLISIIESLYAPPTAANPRWTKQEDNENHKVSSVVMLLSALARSLDKPWLRSSAKARVAPGTGLSRPTAAALANQPKPDEADKLLAELDELLSEIKPEDAEENVSPEDSFENERSTLVGEEELSSESDQEDEEGLGLSTVLDADEEPFEEHDGYEGDARRLTSILGPFAQPLNELQGEACPCARRLPCSESALTETKSLPDHVNVVGLRELEKEWIHSKDRPVSAHLSELHLIGAVLRLAIAPTAPPQLEFVARSQHHGLQRFGIVWRCTGKTPRCGCSASFCTGDANIRQNSTCGLTLQDSVTVDHEQVAKLPAATKRAAMAILNALSTRLRVKHLLQQASQAYHAPATTAVAAVLMSFADRLDSILTPLVNTQSSALEPALASLTPLLCVFSTASWQGIWNTLESVLRLTQPPLTTADAVWMLWGYYLAQVQLLCPVEESPHATTEGRLYVASAVSSTQHVDRTDTLRARTSVAVATKRVPISLLQVAQSDTSFSGALTRIRCEVEALEAEKLDLIWACLVRGLHSLLLCVTSWACAGGPIELARTLGLVTSSTLRAQTLDQLQEEVLVLSTFDTKTYAELKPVVAPIQRHGPIASAYDGKATTVAISVDDVLVVPSAFQGVSLDPELARDWTAALPRRFETLVCDFLERMKSPTQAASTEPSESSVLFLGAAGSTVEFHGPSRAILLKDTLVTHDDLRVMSPRLDDALTRLVHDLGRAAALSIEQRRFVAQLAIMHTAFPEEIIRPLIIPWRTCFHAAVLRRRLADEHALEVFAFLRQFIAIYGHGKNLHERLISPMSQGAEQLATALQPARSSASLRHVHYVTELERRVQVALSGLAASFGAAHTPTLARVLSGDDPTPKLEAPKNSNASHKGVARKVQAVWGVRPRSDPLLRLAFPLFEFNDVAFSPMSIIPLPLACPNPELILRRLRGTHQPSPSPKQDRSSAELLEQGVSLQEGGSEDFGEFDCEFDEDQKLDGESEGSYVADLALEDIGPSFDEAIEYTLSMHELAGSKRNKLHPVLTGELEPDSWVYSLAWVRRHLLLSTRQLMFSMLRLEPVMLYSRFLDRSIPSCRVASHMATVTRAFLGLMHRGIKAVDNMSLPALTRTAMASLVTFGDTRNATAQGSASANAASGVGFRHANAYQRRMSPVTHLLSRLQAVLRAVQRVLSITVSKMSQEAFDQPWARLLKLTLGDAIDKNLPKHLDQAVLMVDEPSSKNPSLGADGHLCSRFEQVLLEYLRKIENGHAGSGLDTLNHSCLSQWIANTMREMSEICLCFPSSSQTPVGVLATKARQLLVALAHIALEAEIVLPWFVSICRLPPMWFEEYGMAHDDADESFERREEIDLPQLRLNSLGLANLPAMSAGGYSAASISSSADAREGVVVMESLKRPQNLMQLLSQLVAQWEHEERSITKALLTLLERIDREILKDSLHTKYRALDDLARITNELRFELDFNEFYADR